MRISIAIITLLILTSCAKEGGVCWSGTGDDVMVVRQIESFHHLEVHGAMDVEFIPNSGETRIELECGQKLQDGFKTEVENGRLLIRNVNRCNWMRSLHRKVKIKVYGTSIDSLTYYGNGKFEMKDTNHTTNFTLMGWDSSGDLDLVLNSKLCYIKMNTGTSDVTLHGKADFLYYYSLSQSFIYGRDMLCREGFAIQKGYGDFYINPGEKLFVEITRPGNVYYPGGIPCDQRISGGGKLIPF